MHNSAEVKTMKRYADSALPGFLAIAAALLAVLWAVPDAFAAEVQLRKISPVRFEVSGGEGAKAWRIEYGTRLNAKMTTAPGVGDTAYFSHGNWLRRVDVARGVVTGRWRFPGQSIVRVEVKGDRVAVEMETTIEGPAIDRRVFDFDPANPVLPNWSPIPFSSVISMFEADLFPANRSANSGFLKNAQQRLPEVEDKTRRDPSPWQLAQLGRIYKALGRPEASQVFDQAVRIEPADYLELLNLSVFLDEMNETAAARIAFERGYEDFWKRGNDPRLVAIRFGLMQLYGLRPLTGEVHAEVVERAYRIAPRTDDANVPWEAQARYLERMGQNAEAEIWRQRADDAGRNSLLLSWLWRRAPLAFSVALIIGTLLGALLYAIVLSIRYRPQRRIQAQAYRLSSGPRRLLSIRTTGVEYWSPRDRIGFFTFVIITWFALGYFGSAFETVIRASSTPATPFMGTFAGPETPSWLELRFTPSPERDLFLALAYQQDGQRDRAEALYRKLPGFAEAWNNLGALLKVAGKTNEAAAAFEQALALKPDMAEAQFNLGRPANDLWSQLQGKYRPGEPMIAVPERERMTRLMGRGTIDTWLDILAGPFSLRHIDTTVFGPNKAVVIPLLIIVGGAPLLPALLIPFTRRKDVTQPPSKLQWLLEVLFPGTAPDWGYFMGVVTAAYTWLLFRSWTFMIDARMPFSENINLSAAVSSYGVPPDPQFFKEILESGKWLYYGGTIFILVMNAALLWRRRHRVPQS